MTSRRPSTRGRRSAMTFDPTSTARTLASTTGKTRMIPCERCGHRGGAPGGPRPRLWTGPCRADELLRSSDTFAQVDKGLVFRTGCALVGVPLLGQTASVDLVFPFNVARTAALIPEFVKTFPSHILKANE